MHGVFKCPQCSTHFAEVLPPLWLEYWPTHCDEPTPLVRVLPAEAELPLVAVGAGGSTPVALAERPELPSYVAQECPYELKRRRRPPRRKPKRLLTMFALYVVRAEFLALPLPLVAILGI